MKKYGILLIFCLLIVLFAITNLKKEDTNSSLSIGDEVTINLNDDLKLDFYILNINEKKQTSTLIAKNSVKNVVCEDSECPNLFNELNTLKKEWKNIKDIRLVNDSDILSEEDLQINTDSICTRLDSYLNPDKKAYYIKTSNEKIGYVKKKDNNCVEISFNITTKNEYSLKPIIVVSNQYIDN